MSYFDGSWGTPFSVPSAARVPFVTSTPMGLPLMMTTRSHGQEGLCARKTANPRFMRSTQIINSDIAPIVPLDSWPTVLFLWHSLEQNRRLAFHGNSMPHVSHVIMRREDIGLRPRRQMLLQYSLLLYCAMNGLPHLTQTPVFKGRVMFTHPNPDSPVLDLRIAIGVVLSLRHGTGHPRPFPSRGGAASGLPGHPVLNARHRGQVHISEHSQSPAAERKNSAASARRATRLRSRVISSAASTMVTHAPSSPRRSPDTAAPRWPARPASTMHGCSRAAGPGRRS